MKYLLYIPGMKFDGSTIEKGGSLGGSESAGYYVARELARRGHDVTVFSNMPDDQPSRFDDVIYYPIGNISDQYPFGDVFGKFAESVPHDVLLAQRVPHIFHRIYHSKINLLWLHDLALKRGIAQTSASLWNLDRILAVSEFHKNQIIKTYGIHERIMGILPNGIDQALYAEQPNLDAKFDSKTMLYSSRPERGLDRLVMPGGIMEQLHQRDPEIRLIVCGYDNTTRQMQGYYNQLWEQCRKLPNVDLYPPQSKKSLAQIMRNIFLHVYPTSFEETSCITVMEAQAAGTPVITSKIGALAETLNEGGVIWCDEGTIDQFVKKILVLSQKKDHWMNISKAALFQAHDFDWELSVDELEKIVVQIFEQNVNDKHRIIQHFLNSSDIIAALKLSQESGIKDFDEYFHQHYPHLIYGDMKKFYEKIADYNTNQIKNNHRIGEDHYHISMPRIAPIVETLSKMPSGELVLDYGCCIGQQTVAYARLFPHLKFIAVDIAEDQIRIGRNYCREHQIQNIIFYSVNHPLELIGQYESYFDLIICSEVLEHVIDYEGFLKNLQKLVKSGGRLAITVPSGPHEAVRWNTQTNREHLHHFEQSDIREIFSKCDHFDCLYIFQENRPDGSKLGNFFVTWTHDGQCNKLGRIDYQRKFNEQKPRQTVSVCMIIKPDGHTLGRTLKSIQGIADEIIIGIDGIPNDGRAWEIAHDFGAKTFEIESPLQIGFDAARNQTIEKASMDWILWIDDDEVFEWPEHLIKYLRNNQYDSYAIAQHHISAEPAGLLKTDFPCRIFRNHLGVKFFGMVHEHPEITLNQGIGFSLIVHQSDIAILHDGYDSEATRQRRFMRNIPLMIQDHEKYPERELGQFLWLRDLVHMNRFELAQNGGRVHQVHVERAQKVLDVWRKIMKQKKYRMIKDSIPYVNEASDLLTQGQGIDFEIGCGLSQVGIGDHLNGSAVPSLRVKLVNKQDLELFAQTMIQERIEMVQEKYL